MKIFEINDKVNFVDENNVFVGFDARQQCCESADWFISDFCYEKLDINNFSSDSWTEKYDGWTFDIENYDFIDGEFDCGGCIRFALVKDNKTKYLYLYNHHNGYYSHGFTIKNGEKILIDDSI